jgi:NADH-quinone oxidoreductase subunit J
MDVIIFLICAIIAVACGINLVVQKHPISAALSLVGVMGALAVLYLLLGGPFIAAAQVIVYAGAVMVLFVFVIMLLNAGAELAGRKRSYARLFGPPLLAIFVLLIAYAIQAMLPRTEGVQFGRFTGGSPEGIGIKVFTDYLLPFEVVSVLILIAILGAIVLAQKEIR